jgi:RNA polymerase sigma-70 factor (ECF subfamily)
VILVLLTKQGDMAAFGELVEKYKRPLLNYVTRTLRDPTEAEDIAQNAFVRVFKALDRFRLKARFSTWLFAIARNLCLNELRRRSRHLTSPLDREDGNQEDKPHCRSQDNPQFCTAAEALARTELQEKVEEALAALPEPQRTAILLLREEELSYRQIAAILKRSLSATRSLIHRGRQTMKSRLMPYLRNGDWPVATSFCSILSNAAPTPLSARPICPPCSAKWDSQMMLV